MLVSTNKTSSVTLMLTIEFPSMGSLWAHFTSTHNVCFEQIYENYQSFFFLSENFQFLKVKFSIYLNRHVFAMELA